jgi:hypothetical protein
MRPGRFMYIIGLLVLVGLFGLMAGCSDNKEPVSSNNDNTQYQQVTAEVNQLLDSSVTEFAGNLTMIQEAETNTHTEVLIDARYSSYNPDSVVLVNDGWHVVYAADLVAGYNMELIDSLQFRKQGWVQNDARDCDQFTLVHRFSNSNPDTTGDYRNSSVLSHMNFSNLNTTQAVISGTKEHVITTKTVDGADVVKRTYDMNLELSGITVNKADNGWTVGCPASGTITGTVNYTVQLGSAVPTTTTWTYEITFTNGEVSATVTAGPYQRTYTATVCQ